MTLAAFAAGCADNSIPRAQLPELDTTNPLLAQWETPHATPPFSAKIELAHYEPAFEAAIACPACRNRRHCEQPGQADVRQHDCGAGTERRTPRPHRGVFFNLLSADTSDEMQEIALRVQPKLTELSNDISRSIPTCSRAVKAVYEHPGCCLERRTTRNCWKTPTRASPATARRSRTADKELYRQYTSELSALTLQFGQNALAATNAFALNITDPKQVAELPAFVKEGMAADAKARGEKGWTVTLQAPSYVPFVTYSSNRALKEKLWRAYNSRALGGQYDNTEIVRKIANTRLKIANLLGYKCYADYVLERRMAKDTPTVEAFLEELLAATKEHADREYRTVSDYAAKLGFEGELMPWDWGYYSQKYRDAEYALNDEVVKPYFQLENVKKGVFLLANKLYGLNFTPNPEIDVYHPDVTAYDVTDEKGRFMAVLYLDFFPRASKTFGRVDDRIPRHENRGRRGDAAAGVAGDELHEAHRGETLRC